MNDNGRRILTRALRMSCGWRMCDDMAGAVRDRHRRRSIGGIGTWNESSLDWRRCDAGARRRTATPTRSRSRRRPATVHLRR